MPCHLSLRRSLRNASTPATEVSRRVATRLEPAFTCGGAIAPTHAADPSSGNRSHSHSECNAALYLGPYCNRSFPRHRVDNSGHRENPNSTRCRLNRVCSPGRRSHCSKWPWGSSRDWPGNQCRIGHTCGDRDPNPRCTFRLDSCTCNGPNRWGSRTGRSNCLGHRRGGTPRLADIGRSRPDSKHGTGHAGLSIAGRYPCWHRHRHSGRCDRRGRCSCIRRTHTGPRTRQRPRTAHPGSFALCRRHDHRIRSCPRRSGYQRRGCRTGSPRQRRIERGRAHLEFIDLPEVVQAAAARAAAKAKWDLVIALQSGFRLSGLEPTGDSVVALIAPTGDVTVSRSRAAAAP